MKWIKSDKTILDDETGHLVAVLPASEDELRDKVIELAPEMLSVIISFVEDADSNSFKIKSTYDKFKKLINKFPKFLIEDKRLDNEGIEV